MKKNVSILCVFLLLILNLFGQIKEISNPTKESIEKLVKEKLLKENESVEKFPDEIVLREKELLVLGFDKNDRRYNKINKNLKKNLDKFYPYKYIIIDEQEAIDYLTKDYKYILISKYTIGETNNSGFTYAVPFYYYVLKDLKTLDIYCGKNKVELENYADEHPVTALKNTLKVLKKYYNWKNK